MENQSQAIASIYKAFKVCSRTQTFNTIAQKNLDPDFSARGIFAKYKMDCYRFMDTAFLTEGHELNIYNLHSEEKINNFIADLNKEIQKDKNLKAQLVEAPKFETEAGAIEAKEAFEWMDEVAEIPATQPEVKKEIQPEVKKPVVKVEEKQVQASFGLNIDLGSILNESVKTYLDGDQAGILAFVGKRIEEEAMKLRPNHVTVGTSKPVEIKGKLHKSFKQALMLVTLEKQLYIAGPAGTGKTTLSSQIAEALSLRFGHISCTAGMSEAHLLGRMVADGSYIGSEFVDLYENGGVFLFDEIDASDPNTLLIVNSALANGHMSVPNRKDKPQAKRHANFHAICAGNTWGNGSNEYAGRSVLDAAFLDRFSGSKINVDYDRDLEKELCASFPEMALKLWSIRDKVASSRIRRVVSTRAFVSASRQLSNGSSQHDFLEVFFTGWSVEEKNKALQA